MSKSEQFPHGKEWEPYGPIPESVPPLLADQLIKPKDTLWDEVKKARAKQAEQGKQRQQAAIERNRDFKNRPVVKKKGSDEQEMVVAEKA